MVLVGLIGQKPRWKAAAIVIKLFWKPKWSLAINQSPRWNSLLKKFEVKKSRGTVPLTAQGISKDFTKKRAFIAGEML